MKLRTLGLLSLVVALAFSLGACGCFQQAMRGEQAPPPAPEQKAMVAPEEKHEMPAGEAAAPSAEAPEAVVAGLDNIYFDFDKYEIRPGDAEILKKDYEWFGSNSGKVRIEGNCDERGTVEYNLVLGQKRADAAKAYLVNLGVDTSRLETVSYGKEKPVDQGHDEAAWAKNRRDHFTPLK